MNITKNFGFTLLETLVALSILAISLGVAYQVFTTALNGTQLANDYAQASMYADSHLAQISKKVHLMVGESDGNYNDQFKWNLNIQPLVSTNSRKIIKESTNSYQVVLNVSWRSSNKQRSIRVMTFRLGNT